MSCMLAAIVCVVLGRVARTVWVIDGRVLAEGLGLFDEIGLVAGGGGSVAGVCAKQGLRRRGGLTRSSIKKLEEGKICSWFRLLHRADNLGVMIIDRWIRMRVDTSPSPERDYLHNQAAKATNPQYPCDGHPPEIG